MKLLISSGLYGRGLVPVNTPQMVARYNACLEAVGQEPTKLETFSIDAVGWSPEVAEEKGHMDYLSLGAANRFAIVLTPEQSGLPVYRPVHSFDRIVMEKFFMTAKSQVADLTGRTGLWLDFSHELTRFASPLDLLTVEWVNIATHDAAGIMHAAVEQRQYAAAFMESDTDWADKKVREKIISSATMHGDLRFRSAVIPEIKFTDVRSFYSRAFGGTYIFRDIAKSAQVLLMEDIKQLPHSSKHVVTHPLKDEMLTEYLEVEDIVDIPLGWYKQQAGLASLERLREYLFADAYYAAGEEQNLLDLTPGQQKSWLAANEGKVDPLIFELERLTLDLRQGVSVKELKLSPKLRALLMHPSKEAQKYEIVERVVWHLIARLAPYDIERLFERNRVHFYLLYSNWPLAKRQWAVKYLVSKGYPKK